MAVEAWRGSAAAYRPDSPFLRRVTVVTNGGRFVEHEFPTTMGELRYLSYELFKAAQVGRDYFFDLPVGSPCARPNEAGVRSPFSAAVSGMVDLWGRYGIGVERDRVSKGDRAFLRENGGRVSIAEVVRGANPKVRVRLGSTPEESRRRLDTILDALEEASVVNQART